MSRRDDILKSFNKYKEETNERVRLGIEQNRKGFAVITVKDKDGNPVPGVKIKAKQKRHEFMHGANLFMLDEFENEEKNEKYKALFRDAFNTATLPFYWNGNEPVRGKLRYEKDSPKLYRRPAPDLCLEYCAKNNIIPKAHCLSYFAFHPEWLDNLEIPDIKRLLEKRYSELSERYSDKIPGWEVINELLCCGVWSFSGREKFYIADDVFDWNFRLAEKYFRSNELIVNEATPHIWSWESYNYTRSAYYLMIKQGLEHGLRIDTVGMQYHVFMTPDDERTKLTDDLYNPKTIFSVLDTYEKLGKPIQITEVTLPAYTDSAEDEQLQAELIEQLYSIWFSHKATEAVIYWNLPDGYAAFAPKGDMSAGENFYRGGLLRFDLSKKPSYEMIHHLFNERWHTETETESKADGIAKFKGFYGEYELSANGKTFDIMLNKSGYNDFEITV